MTRRDLGSDRLTAVRKTRSSRLSRGPPHLPTKNLHLVAEDQDLDISFQIGPTTCAEDAPEQRIEEQEQHGSPSSGGERMLQRPERHEIGINEPFGLAFSRRCSTSTRRRPR
jgi:hypothetical protein